METTTFSWTVHNFSNIYKIQSNDFYYDSCPWNIILEKKKNRIGLFLNSEDTLCYGKEISFGMKIYTRGDIITCWSGETSHIFNMENGKNLGWKKFIHGKENISLFFSEDDSIEIFITMNSKNLCEKTDIYEHIYAFVTLDWLTSDAEITCLPLEIIDEIMYHFKSETKTI